MVLYDKIDETLDTLQKWVTNHKSLPKIGTNILKHFINVCEGNSDETKKLIELHYSVRANHSNLFIERDPLDKGSQITLGAIDVIYIPELTPENYIIQVSRMTDYDPEKYLFVDSVKVCGMIYDNLFCTLPDTKIIDGIITIFDVKGFSLKHLSKVNLSALRAFLKFFEKTIAFKIREIHVINCPSYMNKIMAFIKPFMSDHLSSMMNFHEPNSETLFKHISKDLLPIEIGGTGSSLDILKKKQIQDLTDNRNYLMDPNYWKLKGNLTESVNGNATNGMEGNFRSLNLD